MRKPLQRGVANPHLSKQLPTSIRYEKHAQAIEQSQGQSLASHAEGLTQAFGKTPTAPQKVLLKALQRFEEERDQALPLQKLPMNQRSEFTLGKLIEHNSEMQRVLGAAQSRCKQVLEQTSVIALQLRRTLKNTQRDLNQAMAGLQQQAQYLASAADLSQAELQAYLRCRVPINHATRSLPVNDRMCVSVPDERLTAGAVHHIEVLDYDIPLGPGLVQRQRMVFKAEPMQRQHPPDLAHYMGMDTNALNLAGRAVATHRLDDALGLGLVPKTDFALHNDALGVVMGFAPGESLQSTRPARLPLEPGLAAKLREHEKELSAWALSQGFQKCALDGDVLVLSCTRLKHPPEGGPAVEVPDAMLHTANFNDPTLRQRLCDLNYLGALTGQCDLHLGNYAVSYNGDGTVNDIAAFDCDIAFGPKLQTVESLYLSADGMDVSRSHATQLPNVISRRAFEGIMRLTSDALKHELDGLITPAEIEATTARLAQLQAHCTRLEKEGRVIDRPDQWASPEIGQKLGLDVLNGHLSPDELMGATRRLNMVARDAGHLQAARLAAATRSDGDPSPVVLDRNVLLDQLNQFASTLG